MTGPVVFLVFLNPTILLFRNALGKDIQPQSYEATVKEEFLTVEVRLVRTELSKAKQVVS